MNFPLLNKQITFYHSPSNQSLKGTILDKVRASDTMHTTVDNYVVVDEAGNAHVIDPIKIKTFTTEANDFLAQKTSEFHSQ